MARFLRPGWLALLLPIASGITFYASWIAIYPGRGTDPCGTNDLPGTGIPSPFFFVPFIVLPPLAAAANTSRAWRPSTSIVARAIADDGTATLPLGLLM